MLTEILERFSEVARYTDPNTGLIYMRARWYDPTSAQFLTVDPLETETHQPYAYANDNPVAYTDPSGDCSSEGEILAGVADVAVDGAEDVVDPGAIIAEDGEDAAINAAICGGEAGPSESTAPEDNPGLSAECAATDAAAEDVSPVLDPADFAGKTPAEIDQLAREKGLIPKGPDPMNGRGSYIDPVTGEQRVLSHPNEPGGGNVHVNDPSGQRLDINGNPVSRYSPSAHLPIGQP